MCETLNIKEKIKSTLVVEGLIQCGMAFGIFFMLWKEFIPEDRTYSGKRVFGAILKESIVSPAIGILCGYLLRFVVDRMYNRIIDELNLFVVAPFLLYFLCDNPWIDLNGIFAMVTLGLSVSSMRFTFKSRSSELPASQIWLFFNHCSICIALFIGGIQLAPTITKVFTENPEDLTTF